MATNTDTWTTTERVEHDRELLGLYLHQASSAAAQGAALEPLAHLVSVEYKLDDLRLSLVRRAREQGASWADIARVLGISKQSAHHRYASLVTR